MCFPIYLFSSRTVYTHPDAIASACHPLLYHSRGFIRAFIVADDKLQFVFRIIYTFKGLKASGKDGLFIPGGNEDAYFWPFTKMWMSSMINKPISSNQPQQQILQDQQPNYYYINKCHLPRYFSS